MRRRWIADEVSGDRAALRGEQAAHLARVLRARLGQEYEVAAGGRVRRGRIVSLDPDRVEFALGEEVPVAAAPDVTLLLAVFKFDRMEWAIEKVTELGVSRVVPVMARRTGAHLAAAAEKRVERWRRIAREASQQSRRAAPPEIAAPAKLQDAIAVSVERRIVLSEVESALGLKQALHAAGCKQSVALAVGPEGGWTEQELKLFADAGWISASLGHTILRAETAAIAALAVVMAELGD